MQHAHRSLLSPKRPALPLAWVAALVAGATPLPASGAGSAPRIAAATQALSLPGAALPGLPVAWQRSRAFPGLGDASAVAVDASATRIAAGDEDGAWLALRGEPARRVAAPGPVRDLAFDAEGTLWIAGDEGLFALDAEGRLHERTPSAGEDERRVNRVAAAEGVVLCGTAAGAFASRDGRSWTRLDAGLPDGDVAALALGAPAQRADGAPGLRFDLWLVVDGELFHAHLHTAPRLEADAVSRPPVPQSAFPGVDLLASAAGSELVLLSESSLSLLRESGWETRRPDLPAGATPQRLAHLAGRLWIATDAGLLEERSGRFVRAFGPAGSDAVAALAGVGPELWAAGPRGVLEAKVEERAPVASADGPPSWVDPAAGEPEVLAVQQATLRYLDLHPSRIRDMQGRLARSGWLPTLRITGDRSGRRFRRQFWDEAFTGGDYRSLYDHGIDRTRDFGAQVQLTWNLGDVAYAPRTVELSRESRELTKLRDQILAQVVQLYFARRRVLLDLALLGEPEGPEAQRLRLRADELAAGLDAWTGGWWSARVPPRARPGSGASGGAAHSASAPTPAP
jgi:hypothetical protein